MKFFDRYKLSLHNINNNKSRSILTTIIVFIISLLMTFILSIAVSFSINYNDIVADYYQNSGEQISVEYSNYSDSYRLQYNDYMRIKDVIIENEEGIYYTYYSLNGPSELCVQNHRYANTEYIEIIEGMNANLSHENTNKVLVSSTFAQKYYENTNIVLKPNSKFEYEMYFYSDGASPSKVKLELEVIGFYKTKKNENQYYNPLEASEVIMDIEYILANAPSAYVQTFSSYYLATKTNFNKEEFASILSKITNELNDILPKNESGNDSVFCGAIDEIFSANVISMIVLILAVFLCLVLILLSIGSLANTIMISVDKNKKFIGLLKALGLNEGDLKSTIRMESITTIVLGVLLAFIALYIFNGPIQDLNTLIISSMFSHYLSKIDFEIIYYLPIYIPLIVLTFFITFTLLFAKGSMSRIARLDPMVVISEVA